ncbi:MAG: flagellar export chaperone FliS [Fibrobacteres bacterium]|nr:flagellar export chaperone FliS [Fibrobacterota bacterium]
MSYAHQSYKNANVTTADRGKLVIMIYDHCIKWTKKAEEELDTKNVEKMVRAVQRVQNGLTELMCALDMERGGDIARNLFRLYEFYSRHLTQAIKDRSVQALRDVAGMMSMLREAWLVAIENVRREDHGALSQKSGAQLSLVS